MQKPPANQVSAAYLICADLPWEFLWATCDANVLGVWIYLIEINQTLLNFLSSIPCPFRNFWLTWATTLYISCFSHLCPCHNLFEKTTKAAKSWFIFFSNSPLWLFCRLSTNQHCWWLQPCRKLEGHTYMYFI